MHILIVDDEELQRCLLEGFLQKQGFQVTSAANGAEALEEFLHSPVDLVLLDHRMPDMNGDELLARIKAKNPLVRAIMITAFATVDTAVKVMQLGADDFLEKPVDLTQLLNKIQEIQEQLFISNDVAVIADAIHTDQLPVRMIAESRAMKNVLSMVLRAAPTPWTVLLHGETGTGKELVARLLHQLSLQKDGPFIELNCAAIPDNLFESELFGHERGAFTGAEARRKGVFEQAHTGTLFLDEVGELPHPMQAKLLRALQDKTITRVGGETPLPVDARIVAATNRNLKEMVSHGSFREDLYFRLNVIEIEIPPLRERKKDIQELVPFFLNKFNSTITFDDQALSQLTKYDYPGNIRELEHIIQRTITLTRAQVISLRDLPDAIRRNSEHENSGKLNQRLAQIERQMILDALDKHEWVQTKAAESLGISERVLRYKMEKSAIGKKSGKG